jgi:DNA-binding protein YbaB
MNLLKLKTNNMGFLSNIVSATIKTALTPIAVVKDAVNIATGEDVDSTKDLLSSAADDASEAMDELFGG